MRNFSCFGCGMYDTKKYNRCVHVKNYRISACLYCNKACEQCTSNTYYDTLSVYNRACRFKDFYKNL